MAATSTYVRETVEGNTRKKLYKITHDGSDTSIDIAPGTGFSYPVGPYTSFSESSGTFTFTIVAGTNGQFSYISFMQC